MSLNVQVKYGDDVITNLSHSYAGVKLKTKKSYLDKDIKIEVLSSTEDATATAADILAPQTAYSADGSKLTGTIPTKTGEDITSIGGIVTVPAGYYAQEYSKQGDPSGDATLESGDQMLNGVTAYSQGVKYTGTIPNNGAVSESLGINGSYIIPEGYHNGEGIVSQNITTHTDSGNVDLGVGATKSYSAGYYYYEHGAAQGISANAILASAGGNIATYTGSHS